jgi:isopentenyl-diphosphate delta-isomerase
MERKVIVVNQQGQEIGSESLLKAHTAGTLHRSFGVFIINSQNHMLLQKRNINKMHSGGLWCNTCSSHPNPGEKTLDAAHRRLMEEMDIDCPLQEAFTFIYQVNFEKNHICEHEFGHVFIGFCDTVPHPNPEEVDAYRWMSLDRISRDIVDNPSHYAYWFKRAFDSVILFIKECQKEHFSTERTLQPSVKELTH